MPILCFMIPLPPQTHGRIVLFPPFLNFSYFLWKTMEQHHQGIIDWMILIQKMFKNDLRCDFSKHTLSLHAWLVNFNKCSLLSCRHSSFFLDLIIVFFFFFSIEDCIDACMPVWTLGSGTVSSSIQKQCGLSFLTSVFVTCIVQVFYAELFGGEKACIFPSAKEIVYWYLSLFFGGLKDSLYIWRGKLHRKSHQLPKNRGDIGWQSLVLYRENRSCSHAILFLISCSFSGYESRLPQWQDSFALCSCKWTC